MMYDDENSLFFKKLQKIAVTTLVFSGLAVAVGIAILLMKVILCGIFS